MASGLLREDVVAVVLGAQWGDEGKGKLVDILAGDADFVCRCAGGNNAGHTVCVGAATYDFHILPSGIVTKEAMSIIGNGTVIHLKQFFDEIDHNVQIDTDSGTTAMNGWQDRLRVSDRAHIVLDLHQDIDGLIEAEKGRGSIGTTKRGIGPTYSDKMSRTGFRIADLYGDWGLFRSRLETLVGYAQRRHPDLKVDVEAVLAETQALGARMKPLVIDTVPYVNKLLGKKKILVEGANAAMLDIDFGTYPYVTSSSTTAGGVCTGLGVPPRHVQSVFGVVKAYSTRVGGGGFPTELTNDVGDNLRAIGHEYGVTTKRPRRCGWLDLVVVKYTTLINGYTSLMITKLDCLDTFETIKIGTTYKLDGQVLESHPALIGDLDRVEVEYETLAGWNTSIEKVRKFDDLPENAKKYIKYIEEYTGVPVQFIGVGPARESTIRVF